MRTDIDAAILDLGNVVIEVDFTPVQLFWARAAGLPPGDVLERFSCDGAFERLERGQMAVREYHRHVCRLLGAEMAYADFARGWNSIFGGICPGVVEFLKEFGKSARVVALSNTNRLHAEHWPSLAPFTEALTLFEKVFLSFELGARKPEPESFRAVLDYLELPPERVAFFDDNPENVAAASVLGLRAYLVKPGADLQALLAGGCP